MAHDSLLYCGAIHALAALVVYKSMTDISHTAVGPSSCSLSKGHADKAAPWRDCARSAWQALTLRMQALAEFPGHAALCARAGAVRLRVGRHAHALLPLHGASGCGRRHMAALPRLRL